MRMLSIFCLLAGVLQAGAGEPPGLVPPGAVPKKVASGCKFTEGPAADAEGNVFFSDSPRNRIMVLRPDGKLDVWTSDSGAANGMRFDARGRLVTCCAESGARAVVRWDKDGQRIVLADRYQGRRLTAPNDLCFDRNGRIYFTDPCYGRKPADGQERFAVYRIDARDGEPIPNEVTRVIDDVDTPNGIAIAPDNKTLYVADSAPRKDGPHVLLAYDILPDGSCKRRAMLHDFGAGRGVDGMTLDAQGNIYGAAGRDAQTGVYVFSPDGKQLGFIRTPETATNCIFGVRDPSTLYITAGTSLYKLRLNLPGPEGKHGAADEKPKRPALYEPKADARGQIKSVTMLAQQEKKRVLVMFGFNTCGWCHKLHRLLADHPDLRLVMRDSFILVMVDIEAPQAGEVLRECKKALSPEGLRQAIGFPFLAVFDADGRILTAQRTEPLEEGDHHDPKRVQQFLERACPRAPCSGQSFKVLP